MSSLVFRLFESHKSTISCLRIAAIFTLVIALHAGSASAQFVVNEHVDLQDFDLSDDICMVCHNFDDDGNCIQLGGCSLVAAIQNANLFGDLNDISFAIPVVQNPTNSIPAIVFPLWIIGNSGSGRVHLLGPGVTGNAPGLIFSGEASAGSEVTGLEISGYPNGIEFRNSSNGLLHGNYIHDGAVGGNGILLSGTTSGMKVGGATDTPGSGQGNYISGNTTGIRMVGGGNNLVYGNAIGFDDQGQASGNSTGILVGTGAGTGTFIGGSLPRQKNVVSNTQFSAISVSGVGFGLTEPVRGLKILGNFIGTSVDGTGDFGNLRGIILTATEDIEIGGPGANDGNIISGNGDGVWLSNGAVRTMVVGNTIGLDVSGTPLPNGDGILLRTNVLDNVIDANVISGNTGTAIKLDGPGVLQTTIKNNMIGRDVTGLSALPNTGDGILIDGASDTMIGGEGDENTIASNLDHGINVKGDTALRNTFRRNAIFANDLTDIAFGEGLWIGNDLGDLVTGVDDDTGPNNLMNFPAGVTHMVTPTNTFISGFLHTSDPVKAVIDLYVTEEPNELGFGGGQIWLGDVTPDSSGYFIYAQQDPLPFPFVSALATDDEGNTSQFSAVCGDPDGDGNPDSDGDGLCDDWEEFDGIDYDGNGAPDLILSEFGAKSDHKDLFLEVDWMEAMDHSHKPDSLSLVRAIEMFKDSPVPNDDTSGVALHIFLEGEKVPDIANLLFKEQYNNENPPEGKFAHIKLGDPKNPCGEGEGDGHFGTLNDRKSSNCAAILGAKRLVSRYVLFSHSYSHHPNSSGIAELPGNDFLVTVYWPDVSLLVNGGFRRDAAAQVPEARRRIESATLVHEMGHTLSLGHGGVDDLNCKPNYPSVMSYALQFPNVLPDRVMDYSRWGSQTLNELELDEVVGLTGPNDRFVLYNQTKGLIGDPDDVDRKHARTDQKPVDWDGQDLDGDGNRFNDRMALSDIDFTEESCDSAGPSVLPGTVDWDILMYNFRFADDFSSAGDVGLPVVDAPDALTEDEVLRMAESYDFDGDGLMNSDDNCSFIANPDQEDLDANGIGDICEVPLIDLGIDVRGGEDPVSVDQDITYTAAVYNLGPEDASDVLVSFVLDQGMTLVSSEGNICSASGLNVDCSVGDLTADESTEVVAVLRSSIAQDLSLSASIAADKLDPLLDNNLRTVETEVKTTTGVLEPETRPAVFQLGAAYPNPFTTSSTIPFDVASRSHVTLSVSNLLGQHIATIEDDSLAPGSYERVFEAGNLPSGVYFYTIKMGGYQSVGKLVLIR